MKIENADRQSRDRQTDRQNERMTIRVAKS